MKKIAIVLFATAVFTSCKKDSTIITGKDINTAEKVSVDRFSGSSATLMIRTATNGMPAANAPINLDVVPFITKGFSPTGAITEYYNFDVRSTTPDDIYVLFKAGASAPFSGQNNIIPSIPNDADYTDFWLVNKVIVPDTYIANSLTSEAEILASGYTIQKTNMIVNCPVVPFGSTAAKKFGGGSSSLNLGWYKGKAVAYFSFEEAPITATASGKVPTSPNFVMFNNNATWPASGFKTETGTDQTHNVLGTAPSSPLYSPLWQVHMLDNASFAGVSNLATAQSAIILNPNAALVNCPTVR